MVDHASVFIKRQLGLLFGPDQFRSGMGSPMLMRNTSFAKKRVYSEAVQKRFAA